MNLANCNWRKVLAVFALNFFDEEEVATPRSLQCLPDSKHILLPSKEAPAVSIKCATFNGIRFCNACTTNINLQSISASHSIDYLSRNHYLFRCFSQFPSRHPISHHVYSLHIIYKESTMFCCRLIHLPIVDVCQHKCCNKQIYSEYTKGWNT